jgi:hypothetical protein
MGEQARTKKLITLGLLGVALVGLVGWDIYVVGWGAPDAQDSISRSILQIFHKVPTANLVVGFVLGHLFWPQKAPLSAEELLGQAEARLTDQQVVELAKRRVKVG